MKFFSRSSQAAQPALKKSSFISPQTLTPPPRPHPDETVVDTIVHVESHLVSLHTPSAFETEQYRLLGQQLEQRHRDQGLSVIAISSASPGDGKTTTVINLAGVLSQAPNRRVLVVETDLRLPRIEMFLSLEPTPPRSLSDAILNPAFSLKEVVTWCAPFNFAVLPAGRPLMPYYEVLSSPHLNELIAEARQQYDLIIVDTPPLIPFADCRLISQWVDGFLVVVKAHKTPREQLEKALDVVEPSKVIGLIFNQDDQANASEYGGYYKTTTPLP